MVKTRRLTTDASGVQLSSIITPMLDMAFQILAFFIMTYHPSALEGHIPGTLAGDVAVQGPGNANPGVNLGEPIHPLELLGEALTLKLDVSPHAMGEIGKIFLRQAADVQDELVTDIDRGSLEQSMNELRRRLEAAKVPLVGKTLIRIRADGEVHQGNLVRVYDTCKRAGFADIQFARPARVAQGR